MKIIVTGGAGFIGSHVVDTYLAAGHEVIVLDDFSSGKLSNLGGDRERLKVVKADIRDAEAVRALIREEKPEVVNHHAAQVSVVTSVGDVLKDLSLNIDGTVTLLQVLKEESPATKFVYATSGGAMYGDSEVYPYTEETPAFPTSPYGLSKLTAERYVWLYASLYGMKATVLRYSNVYGPRQDAHGEAGVCAIFTDRMLSGQPVKIYGDGVATRDYVYVGDVAKANLAALEKGDGEAFNISGGIETTTQQVFDTIAAATGYALDPAYADARPGEVQRSVLSHEKASRLLGWNPMVDFEEGIAETVKWKKSEPQA